MNGWGHFAEQFLKGLLWGFAVIFIALAFLFLSGCAKPVPEPVFDPGPDPQPQVAVTILDGSDPVPEWVIKRAIKVTNKKCITRGYEGVAEVVFFHIAEKNHTRVIYHCIQNEG